MEAPPPNVIETANLLKKINDMYDSYKAKYFTFYKWIEFWSFFFVVVEKLR